MNLLVLGGTQFVGRAIVLEAVARGHLVSVFTRGQRGDDLPRVVERLRGDRDGDLGALKGRTWDAAIDVSGYLPRVVRHSAELLVGAVKRYLFISTISVYADGQDEDAPLAQLADPGVETVTGETYGGLKVLCEGVVREVYGDRSTVVRPGLVVGPHDHTDRFTFWARNLADKETFPMIGSPERPFQVIDTRDLAAFVVRLVERDVPGTFNAVGEHLTWGEVLGAVRKAGGRAAEVVWRGDAAMEAQGVALPLAGEGWAGAMRAPDARALSQGLTRRPLPDSVRDLLAWVRETERPMNDFGLTPEKEAALLNNPG